MNSFKIISGGQAGADRAALDAAMDCGLPHGGWCPPGREALDGPIPLRYQLQETPDERSSNAPDIPRSLRTEWNVRDADGSLVLLPAGVSPDAGTAWALEACSLYGKPCLVADPEEEQALEQTLGWLEQNNIRVLHVAGLAGKEYYEAARMFLPVVFRLYK